MGDYLDVYPTYLAVGLMSGTSLDGIDAALVELNVNEQGDVTSCKELKGVTVPFSEGRKEQIENAMDIERSNVREICELNVLLGRDFAAAAEKVVRESGRTMADVAFVSSHGQTIYHMPEAGATLQIGELSEIAKRTGVLTVGDFRPCDMTAGGEGAPLVPFVDDLLFRGGKKGRVLLNIGGMANVTLLPAEAGQGAGGRKMIGGDTGPGNVLIDLCVALLTEGALAYDRNGAYALAGKADDQWLGELIERDSFLRKPLPKSTGRERYNRELAESLVNEGKSRGLTAEDIVATISSYTVRSIGRAVAPFTGQLGLEEVFVGGGGAENPYLMKHLEKELGMPVHRMEKLGISSEFKEAAVFAVLGYYRLKGRPNNAPGATGAERPVSMGKVVLPC
ncbi:anhydro-N-acetylmuramic acid kinase [Alteribacter lacisalsi]|uniref:Anhydro-N-acetylmuramic acid kinase n=1 Tax=Alteribacter lacisalsi TaxID=2045244 RepID=A0A2W0H3I3_9BACI|nr:anhydro-N-acetylmuramic acid kinase [Alteribacter lacisalsi]PYZ96384.1 anhydro-N-acetylmuramic acid kinase [Alteribacter lacisalsi]